MLDLSAKYSVVVFSIGDTKAGTKMGKLQLKKIEDETLLNCILWEEALSRIDHKIFRTGNIVKILGGSYNEKFNNCLVTSLELLEEAPLGLSETEQNEKFQELLEYVNNFKNENLKTFVTSLMFEYEKSFKISPAAKLMHHNYVGGLLQHTYECVKTSDKVLDMYNEKFDPDTLRAACLLHDFGKIFEYKIDEQTGLIDYDENFRKDWLSHSQWGYTHCMQAGFKDIAKMIAAHHGRTEWGSMIDLNDRDLDPLVYAVHHIDDLSAKYGKISINELN
ncbi:MAG: HD domain-containing protein [Candidatus Gastranaerophilales bacterium]|nr:HD domain-containing protein [Candidatus Gastranaerophilales bacterium]